MTKEDHHHVRQLVDIIWRQGEEMVELRLKWLAAEAAAEETRQKHLKLKAIVNKAYDTMGQQPPELP